MLAPEARGTRPLCRWLLVAWDFEVLSERRFQPIVQLGGRTEHDFTATQNSGDHVHELSGHSTSAHLNAAARSADQLRGLEGFEVPSWADLAAGVRPNPRNAEDVEPASFRTGWQHEAAARVEWQHRERVL